MNIAASRSFHDQVAPRARLIVPDLHWVFIDINVARGAVVETAALKEALLKKQIRQACVDVLSTEPWPTDDDLWDVSNLFLTPHNAWSSPLYLPRVADLWLENLQLYVQGKELLHRAF
jgi:phosphoglycerate dehydrogenase-like enzyme